MTANQCACITTRQTLCWRPGRRQLCPDDRHRPPVSYERYTGQESDEERDRIDANPPDIIWWQEIEPDPGRGETAGQQLAGQPTPSTPAVSPAPTTASKTIKEPGPTFVLKPPPLPAKKKKPKPSIQPGQPALLTGVTPPQGNRSQRFKRVMALAQPKNSTELGQLAAALISLNYISEAFEALYAQLEAEEALGASMLTFVVRLSDK